MTVNKMTRIYVKVISHFDLTGYMQPKKIIWKDGREFNIDKVIDFYPAASISSALTGDCYTVIIQGEEKHLFFERSSELFHCQFGRWFVLGKTNAG